VLPDKLIDQTPLWRMPWGDLWRAKTLMKLFLSFLLEGPIHVIETASDRVRLFFGKSILNLPCPVRDY